MNKFRAFYILSVIALISLITLLLCVIFEPMTTEDSISLISEYELVESEENVTISFSIYNYEDADQNYTIVVFLDDVELDNFNYTIKEFSYLKYVIHFRDINVKNNTILVYKEGELDPIAKITYPSRIKKRAC